jgi:3-methylfumaryl-CoA hydratase
MSVDPEAVRAPRVEHADDVCAVSLVRRMAALLDRDPAVFKQGGVMPRGWHVLLFNPPTRQSQLRSDGTAHLGVTLPDLGLPRLMMGGRRIAFNGDIVIGAQVRRESRQADVALKSGRSGRFALVEVEHRILTGGDPDPVVIETNSYVLREASTGEAPSVVQPLAAALPTADVTRVVTPDEAMLFRYSAITDNPHRIHYDLPYAQAAEGYPALLVNGSLPTMLLLELFREHVGQDPARIESRNLAPMLCGAPLTLTLSVSSDNSWVLRASGPTGGTALEAKAWL